MEALGVALALLPLLISAAENYNNCVGPFSRYKRFAKEAEKFVQLLDVQRIIFRNECQILLESFIGGDVAATMLNNSNHPSWRDPELNQQLIQLLDKSGTACANIINLVSERLREVELECQDIVAILNDSKMQKHKKESRSSWKRCVKTKLRASFSKSRWAETLKDLKDWNADFAILASQSLRSGAKQQNHHRKILPDVEQEISKCNTINEFSRQVYQALERACTKHVEHLAHTCAMVECTKRRGSCSYEVRFQMALAGSLRQRQPIRFVVNSTIDDSSAEENSVLTDRNSGANHGHKRRHGTPPDSVEQRKKKSVRFQSSAVQPGQSPPVITSVGPSSTNSRMKNDLCDHLRQCRDQPLQSHTCIGTLESKIGWRNSVFPASLNGCSERQQAISLDQLISELPRGRNLKEFSIPDRIHLAKTLAVAVLQYHATPWLQMSWKTSDVVFFGTDAESMLAQTNALTMPHFSARVKSAGELSANGLSQSGSTPGVRNSPLYSLGIVLLEIAYWKHWECLKQPPKTPHGNGSWYTDMYQARRLLSSSCSDMGGQYNTIVEHLIECEFRCGQDLNISRLQTAVYRDVVYPLEELEEGFRALHVGRKGFD